jgi:prepilin-type N-terminal cleavage/methylation domain-containing protein
MARKGFRSTTREGDEMTRQRGFTLLELLIVIIIIVLLTTLSVALLSVFFRGQGARQGAMIVTQVLAQAKQEAAKTHKYHFVVFSKAGKDGWMEIHKDNIQMSNGIYDGDQDNTSTTDSDPLVQDSFTELPRNVAFEKSPDWMGISPSGYCSFNSGFSEIQASSFDTIMNGDKPTPVGDIILRVMNKPYVMCLDIDRASGKIRRNFFINEDGN